MDIPADWTFKSLQVAAEFDAHVREQLPWYELATGAVAHVARQYIPDNGVVYDIGASTGNMGRALDATLRGRNARFVPIEPSAEMCRLYAGPGKVVQADAVAFDFEKFDVAICFLVLMFLPTETRRDFLHRLHQKTKRGGALIVFDKVSLTSGYLSSVLHRLTIAGKCASGADPKEIIQKELSLGGLQRPLPATLIADTLPTAVEIFRFGEFVGWVIEQRE